MGTKKQLLTSSGISMNTNVKSILWHDDTFFVIVHTFLPGCFWNWNCYWKTIFWLYPPCRVVRQQFHSFACNNIFTFFSCKNLTFWIYLPKRETTSLKNQIFTFSRGSFNIPVSSYSWRAMFLFGCFQLFPLKIVILNFCSLIIFFQTNPFQYLRSCIPLAFVHHRNVFRLLVVKVEVWLFSGEVWVVTHTHVTSPLTGQDGADWDSPSSEMSRRHLALFWGHMLWWRLLVSINIDIVVKKTRPKHIKWHDSFLQISKWTFASYVW